MLVYVLNRHGKPLMPCHSVKARLLVKQGKAKVVERTPFTIQLFYGSSGYKQSVSLGVDSGYNNIGLSAVTDKKEVLMIESGNRKIPSETLNWYKSHSTDSDAQISLF